MKSFRTLMVIAAASALVLTAASLGLVALLTGQRGAPTSASTCSAPSVAGTAVDVTLTDMGGRMQGAQGMGGRMQLVPDRTLVPNGKVTFLAHNLGRFVHELVILPLATGQPAGARPVGADGRVDESGSLGEASAPCGEGSGDGILPGARSWVTVTLSPGRYELVCNVPGHYLAGMYAELTVR